jgi:hypothetical protein
VKDAKRPPDRAASAADARQVVAAVTVPVTAFPAAAAAAVATVAATRALSTAKATEPTATATVVAVAATVAVATGGPQVAWTWQAAVPTIRRAQIALTMPASPPVRSMRPARRG